jgi:para-aminobenzoate synthetase component 1
MPSPRCPSHARSLGRYGAGVADVDPEAFAWLGGRLAVDCVDITDDPAALDSQGYWAVVATFEGALTFARFAAVRAAPLPSAAAPWPALDGPWRSSMDRAAYVAACAEVRERVARGTVYQVNVCRVLEHELPAGADTVALALRLASGNPAPYAGVIHLPSRGVEVVTASPELFLGRRGDRVESSPIKGTAATADRLLAKDRDENVMIVDLVRNDLSRVCEPGSIDVPSLLRLEAHPGLVHLVSTVSGRLRADAGWPELLAAAFPPGSVSGAPKSTALQAIWDLEPVPRGPYCGAVGWVDADRVEAELAVGIRTFWVDREGAPMLRFGTGAGITWGSDPELEWEETELKAARLVSLASGKVVA